MKYRIAICDDSAADGEYIRRLALAWADARSIAITIDIFPSAEAFLFHYAGGEYFDILLLDIEMKAINGVELAKRVRSTRSETQIAFITGYPEFISEGYEVSALNYLMKPVAADKVARVLDRAIENLGKRDKPIILNAGNESVRAYAGDIVYIEAFAHFCAVITINAKYDVKHSISELEALLGDGFIRCHRSYIAGVKHIKRISKTEITFDSGAKIPISRSNYNAVNQAFIRFFKGEM